MNSDAANGGGWSAGLGTVRDPTDAGDGEGGNTAVARVDPATFTVYGQFTVDTGGVSLGRLKTAAANSQAFVTSSYGVLEPSLGNGSYSWDFRRVGGGSGDAGTGHLPLGVVCPPGVVTPRRPRTRGV
jgi:hypothetical protein